METGRVWLFPQHLAQVPCDRTPRVGQKFKEEEDCRVPLEEVLPQQL